jgi:streptogramin lyase
LNTTWIRTGVAALVIGGLAATSAFATGHPNPPTRTNFASGTAWLASFAPGQVTLLDGSTGAIVDQLSGSRLPGVLPGDHIVVTQAGSGAYVADTHTGVLDRIDGATHEVVSARGVVAADGADIEMYPASDHLFIVDPRDGRVTIADPFTLRASAPDLAIRADPTAIILDSQGHLWFVDMSTSRLDELQGDHIRPTSVTVNPSDRTGLLLVQDRPALIDYTGTDYTGLHPVVSSINPDTGALRSAACLDIDPDDPLTVAGGSAFSRVWTVSGSTGRLFESDLATGNCDRATVVSAGGRRLDAPVEADGRVFLGDETTGQVEVINAATLQPVAALSQVVPPDSQLDLFSKDGIVFFNDPATPDAGVIRPDGTIVHAATYMTTGAPSPGRSGNGRHGLPSFAYSPGETGPGGIGGQYPSAGSVISSPSLPGATAQPVPAGGTRTGANPPGGVPPGGGTIGRLEIITRSLPPATVGERYTQTLTASGGETPYKWAEAGLTDSFGLDANSGIISGLPSTPATDRVVVTVSDAAGTVIRTVLPLVVFPTPSAPPVISAVTPDTGAATGGNTVIISGSRLASATTVDFGQVAAPALEATSDTSLSVTAPAGTPGTVVDITVTSPAGTSSTSVIDRYVYVASPIGLGISSPDGIAAGSDGALWFTNYGNNSIGRITTAGVVTNYTGPGIDAPWGITGGPDGALWFTNHGNNSIGRITIAGVVTNYTGFAISDPEAIRTGLDGALWFTNYGNNSIGRITTAGVVTNYTGPGISLPWGISPVGRGVWFTNSGNNSIGLVSYAGVVTNYTGPGIDVPHRITAAGEGFLWFANSGNNSIGRITPAGVVTNYAGLGISSPEAITGGPDGALWFTNHGNNSIGRITIAGVVTNYTGLGISRPEGIITGPDGALWFTNYGNNSIGRITTAGVVTNHTAHGRSSVARITTAGG